VLENLKSVQSKSDRALLFSALGVADYLLGNLEEAKENFKLGVNNDPGLLYPGIRLHLAKVEEARSSWSQARTHLAELRNQQGYTLNPVLLFLLALNATHRGEASEAELFLSEVQQVRPNAPDVLLFRASQETKEMTRRDIYLRVLDVDPDNFLAHYNLGTIRLRSKDLAGAIEDFRAALSIRPGYRDALLNLANAYRQARQFGDAEEQYRLILEQWPAEDDARVGLALVLRERGEWEEASALLQKVEKEGTTGALAQLLLARGAVEEGNISAALDYGEKALEIDPASYRTRALIGNLYLQLGKSKEAVRHFRLASRVETDVSYPDAVNGLAVAYYLQGDYDEAKEYLDRVIERSREFGNTAAFYVNRGNVHFRLGELSAAEKDYQKAEDLDRSSAIASYNLGVLEGKDDDQRARFHYREAIRRKPSFAEAHFNLGNSYALNEDRDMAIEEYRLATEYDPDLDEAYVNLAIQLIEKEEFEEAIEYLERASERTGGSVVISNALAIIYLQRGELRKAEEMCTASLEVDPADSTARLLKALVRVSQGRNTDAYELLSGVTPGQSLVLSYQTALGIVNMRLGRLRGGIENLENAVRRAREARTRRFTGDALVNLAWGDLFLGEYDDALDSLREASNFYEVGTPTDIQEALSRLESI
jgi:tetratricopeptide (TPR) repeat protein